MDFICVVAFFVGGLISSVLSRRMFKKNLEFENMIEDVEIFHSSPSLKDLVDRVLI